MSKHMVVVFENGPAEAHYRYSYGGAVAFDAHFFTISVIADRNCATSVNLL